MKPHLPIALAAVALVAGSAVAAPAVTSAAAPAPARVADDGFYAHTRWDDDDDDRRRYGRMPRPDMGALRAIGIVRVTEVERDDGRLEVEGRDARGREIDVLMDASGRRVLHWRYDRDDDRDDRYDDRWDD
ncbi:hypothetical protein GCM10009422_10230 [Brevundimonas kwangchunensis]|uniref:PepSY domain-containing protein n=1 Tax=Brevundimonas kwangchunensis TaxID=322163 RepID=A0ABN1GR55_9CAUL